MVIFVVLFALWVHSRNLKFFFFALDLNSISTGFNLLVLLVAIIRVNTILRKNYPKLKTRQFSSIIHISVGLIALGTTVWFSFDAAIGNSITFIVVYNLT